MLIAPSLGAHAPAWVSRETFTPSARGENGHEALLSFPSAFSTTDLKGQRLFDPYGQGLLHASDGDLSVPSPVGLYM